MLGSLFFVTHHILKLEEPRAKFTLGQLGGSFYKGNVMVAFQLPFWPERTVNWTPMPFSDKA